MARSDIFSNSFSAGEIAPALLMRADLQVRNEALKQARNVQIVQGGGFRRRPGTVDIAGLPSDAIIHTLGVGSDDARVLVFYIDGFQERDLDGVLLAEVVGTPWNTPDKLASIQVSAEQDRIVVTSQDFLPAQLTRSGATWALVNLAFAPGLNGGLRQPYWRYADLGVAITPSAYSGSVTVVATAAAFSASHVGYRIRYAEIEMLVTAFTSATQVTATVLGSLYPTLTVTVTDTTGFSAGEEVQGETTQIRGVVAGVTDATHLDVQLLGSYTYFSTTEKLVAPSAFSTISAVALAPAPAISLDWDEALISPAQGYPGSNALHRSRLLLGNFPSAKNVLAGSAVGAVNDFDVGEGADSDAFVDTIGNDSTLGIRHFGSTEQLLILTEAGPHYVPEQVAAPLSATNLEVLKIGPEAVGQPSPVLAAEGLMFSEDKSGRLMIALPTGNVRRSWEIADLSELAYHLMGTPREIALAAATTESDRLVMSLRSDGQLSAMNYRRNQQFSAWSLWSAPNAAWRSITVAGGRIFVVTKRTIGATVTYRLELFREGVWGDGFCASAADLNHLNGATVGIWFGAAKIGSSLVSGGVLVSPPNPVDYPAYEVGLDFPLTAEIVPAIDGTKGTANKYRICRASLDVISSLNVRVNGFSAVGYSNTAGLGGALTAFTGQIQFDLLGGRRRDPTLTITQTEGGPLEVRSLTMEVTS